MWNRKHFNIDYLLYFGFHRATGHQDFHDSDRQIMIRFSTIDDIDVDFNDSESN